MFSLLLCDLSLREEERGDHRQREGETEVKGHAAPALSLTRSRLGWQMAIQNQWKASDQSERSQSC